MKIMTLVSSTLVLLFALGSAEANNASTWNFKADYIEACSCHRLCPCYFNTSPEGAHHCEFNMAVKVAEGHYGDVNLAGAKMWLAGDLGGDFSKGETKAVVITFDPGVSAKQQEALKYVLGKIYPVHWQAVAVDKAPVMWEVTCENARAKLGTGQGEITLKGVKDATGKQSVLQNVAY